MIRAEKAFFSCGLTILAIVCSLWVICTNMTDTDSAWAKDSLTIGTYSFDSVDQNAFVKQTTKMDVDNVSGRVIANGDYVISSAENAQMLVAVQKGSMKNNAKAKLAAENASLGKSQVWHFKYDPYTGSYIITNKKSGKVLTAIGSQKASAKAGTNVVQATQKSKQDFKQRWQITSTKAGYKIYSRSNKKLSLAVSGKAKNNAAIKLAKSRTNLKQRFWLSEAKRWKAGRTVIKSGVYTFKPASAGPDSLLGVPGDTPNKNMQFGITVNHGSLMQMFRVSAVKKPAGYYTIKDIGSSLYLTDSNGKVVQQRYTMKGGQLWKPEVTDNGLVFTNRNGRVLSLANDAVTINAKAVASKTSGTASCYWEISPTTSGITYSCERALEVANTRGAKKGYYSWSTVQKLFIAADLTSFELNMFQRKDVGKQWVPFKCWSVACGKDHSTAECNYIIWGKNLYKGDEEGYRAWYWCHSGGGRAFHSQVCYAGTQTIRDYRTTGYISNGCMRLQMANAKFMYDKVPIGTFASRYY